MKHNLVEFNRSVSRSATLWQQGTNGATYLGLRLGKYTPTDEVRGIGNGVEEPCMMNDQVRSRSGRNPMREWYLKVSFVDGSPHTLYPRIHGHKRHG